MRFSEVLARSHSVMSRALPPLDKLRASVDRVARRWPGVVSAPLDRDREAMARDMLRRVQNWEWTAINTQRVTSAALAVYDPDRRARPDLAPVREFYLSEIAQRPKGAFLDAMLRVYVETFDPDAPHTQALASALAVRQPDIGPRERRLLDAMPRLLDPSRAAKAVAEVMAGAEDPYAALKEIGLQSPHVSGLAKAAHHEFVRKLAPNLGQKGPRDQLLAWIMPKLGNPLQSGATEAIEALLAPWRNRTPDDTLRHDLCESIIAAYNDPRLHEGGIWAGFDQDLKQVFLRWLTKQDMKFFCDMVSATQNNHMWPPRRDVWLSLYDERRIDEAWVAFGSAAADYAKRNLLRTEHGNAGRRFGIQRDRNGNTSLLVMRIGNKIVVDGCHNYKTHIFKIGDPKVPKLYQREYHCDDIMRASRNSKPHNSIMAWELWVRQHV